MRRLTSVSFHLSRFTGVETSPVNEELQKNFPELFMQHLKTENVQRQKHLRTNKNFYLLLLDTAHSCCNKFSRSGRQSTRSSPESLFAKRSRNWPWSAAIFVETRETPGRLKDGERHGTGDKDEKSVNGTQIPLGSFEENGTTFSEILFIPNNFQWNEPKSRVPFTSQTGFPVFFGKWKTLHETFNLPGVSLVPYTHARRVCWVKSVISFHWTQRSS